MTRTWFITGTSSGFGRALTEELLAQGDRVVATVRNPTTMDDLVDRYGDQLSVARLDVIVNNAGYGLAGVVSPLKCEFSRQAPAAAGAH